MYIVQKVLARGGRSEHKKDKDLAYVYYVILLHRSSWKEMALLWSMIADSNEKYAEWIRLALHDLTVLFESETADGPVGVVSELGGGEYRDIREGTVIRVMKGFFEEVQLS